MWCLSMWCSCLGVVLLFLVFVRVWVLLCSCGFSGCVCGRFMWWYGWLVMMYWVVC